MSGFFSESELRQGSLPDCGGCGLYRKCESPKMEPAGDGKRSVLFVGDFPNRHEDNSGVLFSGNGGEYLREVLDDLDIDLDDCWVTNSIICHPVGNAIKDLHVQACRPSLTKTIGDLNPQVIIPLGDWAFRSLMPKMVTKFGATMAKWRGFTIPYWDLDAWVCPTYSPNFVLRFEDDPAMDLIFRQDIEQAVGREDWPRYDCPTIESFRSQINIVMDEDEARARLEHLANRTGMLAWDYETTCLKPETPGAEIVSCAFCLDGEDTWACLMPDSLLPSLSKVLKSPDLEKVASNLKFEDRWTQKFLGHRVNRWGFDTMLAAHYIDNRQGVCSVKFQAACLLGIDPWDEGVEPYIKSKKQGGLNRMKEVSVRDLLMYNGLDALIEYKVMEKQKEIIDG